METLVSGKRPATVGTLGQNLAGHAKTRPPSNDVATNFVPLLSCWEVLDGRVRLILSREGELIAQSAGAGQFFDQEECFSFKNTLALACAPSSDKRLRRIFDVAVGEVATVTLQKRSGDGHFILSATGITAGAIAVSMRVADDEFVTVLADLEEAFGLTRCEMLVLEKLICGHVPQLIADELAISVHTVRAHIRHCYDKLQVSSREELWHRLAPYHLS